MASIWLSYPLIMSGILLRIEFVLVSGKHRLGSGMIRDKSWDNLYQVPPHCLATIKH